MPLSMLEAYDLVRFADHLQARLAAAEGELSPKRGLKSEKEWLAAAAALLSQAREPTKGLLEKVRRLAELAEVRDEYAAEFLGQWVDALERLLAGITFHAGNRDPIIEALFPHLKLAGLRRADRNTVLDFAKEMQRRAASSYVSRMLGQPSYAFAAPVLEALAQAFAKWQSAFADEELPEQEAAQLQKDLASCAKKLEVPVKQAKLLSEAALAPAPGLFEEMGLAARPKKRAKAAAKEAAKGGEEGAAAPQCSAEPPTASAEAGEAPPSSTGVEPAAEPVKPKRRASKASQESGRAGSA